MRLIGETPLGRELPVGLHPSADTANIECSLKLRTTCMNSGPITLLMYSSNSALICSKFSSSYLPYSRGMCNEEFNPNRTLLSSSSSGILNSTSLLVRLTANGMSILSLPLIFLLARMISQMLFRISVALGPISGLLSTCILWLMYLICIGSTR